MVFQLSKDERSKPSSKGSDHPSAGSDVTTMPPPTGMMKRKYLWRSADSIVQGLGGSRSVDSVTASPCVGSTCMGEGMESSKGSGNSKSKGSRSKGSGKSSSKGGSHSVHSSHTSPDVSVTTASPCVGSTCKRQRMGKGGKGSSKGQGKGGSGSQSGNGADSNGNDGQNGSNGNDGQNGGSSMMSDIAEQCPDLPFGNIVGNAPPGKLDLTWSNFNDLIQSKIYWRLE